MLIYNKFVKLCFFGASLIVCFCSTDVSAKAWEDAAEVYKASIKLYELNQWQDALVALQGFVDDFSTNENIPLAYLQMAYCYERLGKQDEKLKSLRTITKEFPESQAAFYAWSEQFYYKLNKVKADINNDSKTDGAKKIDQKSFKDFVIFLENIEKIFGGLFVAPKEYIHWPKPSDYYSLGDLTWWPSYRILGYLLDLYPLSGWNYRTADQVMANGLLALAKDPKKADDLLRALQPCFKKLDDDLPASWKIMHVKLLGIGKGGEKAAKTQLDKYEAYYKKGDPMGIALKTLLLKDAWDQGQMDKVKEINNYFIDNFMGYHELYYPFSRWMDHLYASGDNQEFVRVSKLYMDKTPEGAWRDSILDRWVSLAERKAIKSGEALALIDADQTYYPLDRSKVKKNLKRKIEIYQVADNSSAAVQTMTTLLSRDYWCKDSFDWADRMAASNSKYKAVVDKACSQFGIVREDSNSKARAIYDDLQYRISQDKDRFVEELATKLYTEYRRDYYAIMGIYSTVKFFYSKAAHKQRDKWADLMLSSYPFNPLSQEVIDWQVKAADTTKNFEMLAKWTTLGMKNFPGADSIDQWIKMRLSCFDTTKELQGRVACARTLLKARADSGEPDAIRMLGEYECQTMDTPKQQATYWLSLSGKYKGKYAEVVCNQMAWEYGYQGPVRRWHWPSTDFEGAARGMAALAEQNLRPDWKWKAMFDDVNILSMGGKGTMAMQSLMKKLPKVRFNSDLHRRLDMPNLGYACGREKLQSKVKDFFPKIKTLTNTPRSKMNGMIMLANMYKFSGQGPNAAKAYVSVAAYYKRPISKWQFIMLAYGCLKISDQIALFTNYASQLKTAQDFRPRLLVCIGKNYIAEKNFTRAKSILKVMADKYKASTYTGALTEALAK